MAFLLSFILAIPPLLAGESLTFRVLDEDGAPVGGSVVRLESMLGGHALRRTADPDGAVSFDALSESRYLASARVGDLTSAPVEVAPGDPAQELTLRFRAVREEVVVSAAGAPRADSAALVSVVSSEELDERGEWLLAEALRGLPGLHLRQNGGPGRVMSASVRGLPGPGTAVIVDGAPLRDTAAPQASAASILPAIPTLGIDRVELRRGGGSSLYGTNGMGGVIHIVTRSAETGPRVTLDAGLGGLGKSRAGALLATNGQGIDVSGGLTRTGFREGPTGDDRYANLGGLARASLEAGGVRITGRILGSAASLGLAESPGALSGAPAGIVPANAASPAQVEALEAGTPHDDLDFGGATFVPDLVDPDATQRTRYFAAQASLSGALGARAAWDVRFQELVTVRENEDGPLGTSPWDPASLQTSTWDGGVRGATARIAAAGAHDLTLGGEAHVERMETANPLAGVEARQSSIGFFAQEEFALSDRARIRGAIRMQGFATDAPDLRPAAGGPWSDVPSPEGGRGWSGDAAAAFAVTDSFRLRGSWARGFRAPSLYERFGTWYSSFGYSVYGDPRLEPEFTTVQDLGFAASSPDGGFAAEAAWFRSERPQVIAFGPIDSATDPFGRFSGYENESAGAARGIEACARVALPGATRVRGSFTWTDADPPDNAPDELPRAWLLPEYEGSVVLSGRAARFAWAVDAHLSSDKYGPLFDPTDFSSRVFQFSGMRRVDLVAGWDALDDLRLRLQVRDLFDDRAFESNGFRPLGRLLEVGVQYRFR